MRVIDRLKAYLDAKKLSVYSFERLTGVANGYVSKQISSERGSIGSEVLAIIYQQYVDLSLIWLVTGDGEMFVKEERSFLSFKNSYKNEKIKMLEKTIADKEEIIKLLHISIDDTREQVKSYQNEHGINT